MCRFSSLRWFTAPMVLLILLTGAAPARIVGELARSGDLVVGLQVDRLSPQSNVNLVDMLKLTPNLQQTDSIRIAGPVASGQSVYPLDLKLLDDKAFGLWTMDSPQSSVVMLGGLNLANDQPLQPIPILGSGFDHSFDGALGRMNGSLLVTALQATTGAPELKLWNYFLDPGTLQISAGYELGGAGTGFPHSLAVDTSRSGWGASLSTSSRYLAPSTTTSVVIHLFEPMGPLGAPIPLLTDEPDVFALGKGSITTLGDDRFTAFIPLQTQFGTPKLNVFPGRRSTHTALDPHVLLPQLSIDRVMTTSLRIDPDASLILAASSARGPPRRISCGCCRRC